MRGDRTADSRAPLRPIKVAVPSTRIKYLKRILSVYLNPGKGPLAFWHETPEANPGADYENIGEYYMTFRKKAEYSLLFDENGIPMLDYRGDIGPQYNPIAIAQYGLARYNRFKRDSRPDDLEPFYRTADWLTENLEENSFGVRVWNHHFDWPHRQTLIAPWYSGLAQGQGVSVLVRAALESGREIYAEAATAAFRAFTAGTEEGGVVVRDDDGALWIEEYLLDPPSHILNGFIWGLWGVYDYWLWSKDAGAEKIFAECVSTLQKNLHRFDTGYWSLYELPDTGPPMLTSPYYHFLHVVELRVLHRMTGHEVFAEFADRWEGYRRNPLYRSIALAKKAWFKLWNY